MVEIHISGQLFRFTPNPPLILPVAAQLLGVEPTGGFVVHPDARMGLTMIIDDIGRIIVHGARKYDVARAAASSFLLGLGKSDAEITSEHGPVTGWFDLGGQIDQDVILKVLRDDAELDLRLDAVRVEDEKTGVEAIIWPNGRVIVPSATTSMTFSIFARRLSRELRSHVANLTSFGG
ncbi:MAG: hypothetical protein CMB77_01185 [Euryarchaeota archaeon]|nr:hypothetical protein [Euryarchaeota archaeon]